MNNKMALNTYLSTIESKTREAFRGMGEEVRELRSTNR